ncbi:MAG: alginate export family protein [Acidobacteriia bacterium]|nr:alginate export family protein [Terriglobia bacterium]
MFRRRLPGMCLAAVCAATWMLGEPPSPPPQAGDAAAAPAPIKIGGITVSGSFRTREEDWNWFKGDTGDNTYLYSGNLFRLAFSQSLESVDWQLELGVPFLLALPDQAVAAGTQGQLGLGATYYLSNSKSQYSAMVFAKQGYVRFHNLGGSAGQSLKIGRFEFLDGSEVTPKNATLAALKRDRVNQRLIGNFGWADVQRSFDGMQYLDSQPGGTFTFVGAIPTRGVFQTNGWGETNTGFGYAAYTKPWGTGAHSAETRAMVIYYDDWRPVLKTDNRPLAARRGDLDNIRIETFGGHHLSALTTKAGTLDLLAWGVAQTGNWGRLTQRAYAVDLEGGFQPRILARLKPWLRGGYTNGSGDGNPNDQTHGTFFQILPTPRPFARFPFFNMENNRDLMGALILRPHKNVTTSSEFHALALSNPNDLWYSGGGAFQPWTFGYTGRAAGGAKSLANLWDTSVEWRMSRSITATGYFGYASGRAVMTAIYPKGKNGSLGYLEMAYKF